MKYPKKVLIAGANGFIGKSLIKKFNKNISIGAASRSKINLNQKNLKYFQHDLSKKWNIKFSPDYIIFSLQGKYNGNKRANLEENYNSQVVAIKNCLDFYKKNKCKLIIFLSSIEIYGEVNSNIISEKTCIRNPNFYGASKFYCESILKESSNSVNSLILRLPGIVGNDFIPRCWLQSLKEDFKKNKSINFYNPKSYFNNIFDIDNLVKLLEKIFMKKNNKNFDVINLAAKNPIQINKIIKIYKKNIITKSTLVKDKSTKKSFTIKTSKLINDYNFKPDSTEKMITNFLN